MKMEREKLISLVTAAQGGDAAALDELFGAFYNSVYYFALKTVEDEHTAADVTQETFIEVFSTLGKLKEPAAFVSWLKMITYHQCTRYFKKKKDVIVDEYEDGSSIFDTIADEDEEFLPDAALNQAELRTTVMEMIDKLSAEQRAAVMMFYYDELSVKEIAKIQGVSENTVKSRLNYARQSIKRSVEAYEKRTGIKLRCAGVLPLLLWLFRGYFGGEIHASAAAVSEGVSAATETVLSAASVAPAASAATAASAGAAASATSAASTASAASAASATAATAAAKAVGVPLVAKIIAGIAAAVIAIGGASAAVLLSGDHVHAYTATVVREASCEADGEQKFTCECGESYTERLPAVSHEWGEWAQSKAPTYTALGEEARACAVCSEKETRELAKLPLDKLFRRYPEDISDLAYFSSVDELSAEGVFLWVISHIDATSESKDFENYIFTYTYSIDIINARTTDYLGRTWEYSSITNPNSYDSTEYVYNAADNTVTVVYHGAFGDMPPEITYKGYTAVDETHFEIFYTESIYGESTNAVIKVELVGGDFIVTSHGRVE